MSTQWTRLAFKLNDGWEIPAVGLGTCHVKPDDARNAVQTALSTGYRHIDASQAYGNQTAVGDGVMLACVPRETLFLTTKVDNVNHKCVAKSIELSLFRLHVDYIDLVLMHSPVSIDPAGEENVVYSDWNFTDTWREMEKLVDSGKVRSIGVANFGIQNLETLLASARIVPAVCQLELNPLCSSSELVNFCQSKGIHVIAYSSLGAGNSPLAENQIASKRGTSVIPKSITDSRIRSNYDLNRFGLTMEEMNKLSSLPVPF